ncbi:SLC13 family permease [Conexibacter sp. S30A1]|uniref:SLC13 family permease n=1 Tax=Conexibacter sp. S30A1 TaxID=2937800 RepID=UPI00200C070A|nr:SLC13 family permease [Conexibacter sp. S30A1]
MSDEDAQAAGSSALSWLLGGTGLVALAVAVALHPDGARAAAGQDWPPFVLVAGLLLIGLVSQEDGLFAAGGQLLARRAGGGLALYAGAVVMIAVVTALLNLDTSVAFLTPVLVYAARSRGEGEAPLLYASILLANAGSLVLPGSNLTNLIVLGHVHMSGGAFFRRMAPADVVAVVVTALVIAARHHAQLRARAAAPSSPGMQARWGVGLVAVLAATVLVVALRNAALPVAAVGVLAVAARLGASRAARARALEVLGAPVLVGLFGIAVALGTLGRAWAGPALLLSHLGTWATAALAAGATVLVNNLPAASLLSARALPHPFALLVGLNIGPNLFVSGSLAWVLWWRSARTAQARPSLRAGAGLGLLSAPLALAAAMAVLTLSGGAGH